jgi:hypothetical protein
VVETKNFAFSSVVKKAASPRHTHQAANKKNTDNYRTFFSTAGVFVATMPFVVVVVVVWAIPRDNILLLLLLPL